MKRSAAVMLCAALFFCRGTNAPVATESSIVYVWELHLPDDSIAGWEEDRSRYRIFNVDLFYDLIDGGAAIYDNQGLIAGIVQMLRYDTLYENLMYVTDFGSIARARGMFAAQKKEVGGMSERISGFDTSSAAANLNLGGCTAYATIDRFYIEMYLGGYSEHALALADAASFLSLYQRRIKP